ncbi:kinase-like domain-containing protein, partial [Roridomyces roridus]
YVAKKFFEIGRGRENVSMAENSRELASEIKRLTQGQWFLDKFYERAEETSTEEVIGDYDPSPASSIAMDEFVESTSVDPNSAITWLLEPLRAASMERWSSTLDHPTHPDKAGRTMDAFMHFSYLYSHQTIVFADLQSTKGRGHHGKSTHILFDVMTHTPAQNSGVGDHGQQGIESILAGHACGQMCKGLDMGAENVLKKKKSSLGASKTRKAKRVRAELDSDSD